MKVGPSRPAPPPPPPLRLFGLLCLSLALACCCAGGASAQSSLFGVPSTDVQPAGEAYVEWDFDAHPGRYEEGGFQSYGVFALYGVRGEVEVGLNAYYTRTGPGDAQVELQPNLKWRAYGDGEGRVAAAAGAVFYVPVGRRGGRDALASVYGTVSRRVGGARGARFTAGAYGLVGPGARAGGRGGALFGYEQPLGGRLTFAADWNTGRNRFGYAAAGLGLRLTPRSWLSSAYYFGNEGRGNNSLGLYYGLSF